MRKPGNLHFEAGGCFFDEGTGLIINGQGASLAEAKRLHYWLGRMLQYLEARYGKKASQAAKGNFDG
jgi:hypothetical protein